MTNSNGFAPNMDLVNTFVVRYSSAAFTKFKPRFERRRVGFFLEVRRRAMPYALMIAHIKTSFHQRLRQWGSFVSFFPLVEAQPSLYASSPGPIAEESPPNGRPFEEFASNLLYIE